MVQLHRLREVLALIGFTRFDAVTPDIYGEYESDVERARARARARVVPSGREPRRGASSCSSTRARLPHGSRARRRRAAPRRAARRTRALDGATASVQRPFPGGPYVLLHTLSHLLIAVARDALRLPGQLDPRADLRRPRGRRFGLLLYTASSDAEGTLGGLVAQARAHRAHLAVALRAGELCSNDPVCAQHAPGEGMEGRWLHGAACHGCALIAETSCEMRNDYLDRALVVPTLAGSRTPRSSPSVLMIEPLLALPAHLRERLHQCARDRLLAPPYERRCGAVRM